MTTVRFGIDPSNLKKMPEEDFEVIERIQDGERARLYKLRPILARYMVDEAGQPLDIPAAFHLLGKLSLEEWDDVGAKFAEALLERAVPKANASSSSSLSDPNTPASPSPDGS